MAAPIIAKHAVANLKRKRRVIMAVIINVMRGKRTSSICISNEKHEGSMRFLFALDHVAFLGIAALAAIGPVRGPFDHRDLSGPGDGGEGTIPGDEAVA